VNRDSSSPRSAPSPALSFRADRPVARFRTLLGRALALTIGVGGCNTILDNKPGTLDPRTLSDNAPTDPDGDGNIPDPSKGGDESKGDPGSTDPDAGSPCGPGRHVCHGSCVDSNDPTYGCGAASCEPCKASRGTAACQGNACVIQACDKGYADCNQNPADGCETDLSKAASCGSCNTVCPAATPVCTPQGTSFQCTNGCTVLAPLLCGTECVSPLTSVNHCGGCDAKCPTVEHGEVTCAGGMCQLACKPDYHACGAVCAVNTDPLACGPDCAVCPAPANAVATCQANACGFQCNAGFGNCNVEPMDGCEARLATDPLNCGVCGSSCNGGTCNAGICSPAPDAGP
jgi:hypothetical protein